VRSETNLSFSAGNNLGAAQARGEVLCFLNDDVVPLSQGWLSRMVDGLDGDVVAVGAQLLYPRRRLLGGATRDVAVQHRGIHFVPGAGVPQAVNIGTGEDPVVLTRKRAVAAATAACLVVDRNAFDAVGGFDSEYQYGAEDVDLCWRLRRAGGRVIVVDDAVLYHDEGRTRHRDDQEARHRRQQQNWRRLAGKYGPEINRAVLLERLAGGEPMLSSRPFHVAVTVTRDLESAGYGDWYTAHELGEELERLGWEVSYCGRYRDAWYELPNDVDLLLVLLDTCDIRKVARPGLTTVAWVRNWGDRWLSHPWFDDFDLVLASSRRIAELIQKGSRHHPVTFPLATNPRRFRDASSARSGIVFTGNHWGHDRGIARLAELVPELQIYGKGWEAFPGLRQQWRGALPYADVPRLYGRTAVVVDQTAEPTLPYGAMNSRVFDALACGALVVTDNVVASRELFAGELPTYDGPEDLASTIAELRARPDTAALRARLRQTVLDHHTYAARAQQLQALLVQRARRPSIVLQTSAPDRAVAPTWGDWHLAEALARHLRRPHGLAVHVQTADEWGDAVGAACDIAMHLRGRSEPMRQPGQLHVTWIISHPREVTQEVCDTSDLILVASQSFAEELRRRTSTPVHVFLQATDHDRFRPRAQDAGFTHQLAFVGNSRFTFRQGVKDALAAGLDVAIYGANWDRFVDPDLVQDRHVPNEVLPILYSSVDILLNDHWDDMREHGFLSNRLFDALACGTAVVSDHVTGIEELFGDAVATYHDTSELRQQVERLLADPQARRAMGSRGQKLVVERHTFAARAEQLLAHLADHGLDGLI